MNIKMGKYYKKLVNKKKYNFKKTKTKPKTAPTTTMDIQIAGLTKKPNNQQTSGSDNNSKSKETTNITGISIAGRHKGKEPLQFAKKSVAGTSQSSAAKRSIDSGSAGFGIAGLSSSALNKHTKQSEGENSESGITIGGKAAEIKQKHNYHKNYSHRGYHPYHHDHNKQKRYIQKETGVQEKHSTDALDSRTKGIEIRRPKHKDKEDQNGLLDLDRVRKNRSLFGYHLSQVVHQNNVDRVATETAARLVASGFGTSSLNRQQLQQQMQPQPQQLQQQGVSNSDLATFLRGLGDYMTATANTIVKATSSASSSAANTGTVETEMQSATPTISVSGLQNNFPLGSLATNSANDRVSARHTSSMQSSEMDIDGARSYGNQSSSSFSSKHSTAGTANAKSANAYSSGVAESKELLDFDLNVSDIE